MQKARLFLIFIMILLVETGCTKYIVPDYGLSMSHITQLKSLDAKNKIAIEPFTANSSRIDLNCRGTAPIEFANGITPEQYIHTALINELTLADLYLDSSDKKLSGNIEYINLSTFGDGKWDMGMTFTTTDSDSFSVSSQWLVPFIYNGEQQCERAKQDLSKAVDNFINILINNPNFKAFLTK